VWQICPWRFFTEKHIQIESLLTRDSVTDLPYGRKKQFLLSWPWITIQYFCSTMVCMVPYFLCSCTQSKYTYFRSQNKFSLQTQTSLMTAQKPRKCALSLALLPYALSPLRAVAAAAAWQWRQHGGRGGSSAATVLVAAAWRWWLWQQLGSIGGSLAAAWRVA
jgi:hypothetical protein